MADNPQNNMPEKPVGGIPEGAYGDCVKLFRAREYARARGCFESWLAEHPDDAEAHHLVARLGLHLNQDLEAAAESIRKAAKLSPENAGRYFATLGELFVHQGNYAEAETALSFALEKGIRPDPDGGMRLSAEFNLSLCRKKLEAGEFTGETERHPSVHGEPYSRLTESKRGGMFVVQSLVVHVIALVILSLISGMTGEVREPEDLVYLDFAVTPQEQPAGEAGGGGEAGQAGGGGGEGRAEGALPGPVARSEGVAAPGRAEAQPRAVEGIQSGRTDAERRLEGLKEAAQMQAEYEAEQLQAKLDARRLEGGMDVPRPEFEMPEDMPRAGGLDIDTGGQSAGTSREAAPGTIADREAGTRAAAITGHGTGETGERGEAGGRKSARGIEGAHDEGGAPGMRAAGEKMSSLGELAAVRPSGDADMLPGRRELGIDTGETGAGAAGARSGPGELRSIDRAGTGTASARISAGGGTESSGRRESAGGAKEVAKIAGISGEGGAEPAPSARPSSGGRMSALTDVSAPGRGAADIPSDISRPSDLGISAPGGGASRAEPGGVSGTTGASGPGAPATMGERTGGRVAVSGPGSRSGSTGGRGYAPSSGGGGKSVSGISGPASSGDSLTVNVAPSALGAPGGGGSLAGGPGHGGPDIPDAPVGGGGSLDGLITAKPGGSGSGGGGGRGSGGGGAEVATISGPGRKGGAARAGSGVQSGAGSGTSGKTGGGESSGKGFAAGSLGRPVGTGQDKYASSGGTEASPAPAEKVASLGAGEKKRGRPGMKGPRVTILTPVSGKTDRLAQDVTGTVSGRGVTKATLSVNNDSRVISVVDGRFNASVALFDGRNIITVMAFDPEGNVGKDFVALDYNTPEADTKVTILEPKDGQVFDLSDRSTVMVRGTVDDRSVHAAKLVLNGNPKNIVVDGGRFEQEVALVQEANSIFVEAESRSGERAVSKRVKFSTVNIKPKDMMVILTWDKPHADMDLHIYGPMGGHTFYKSPDRYSSVDAIAEGRLEQDAKDNYGPEVFVMEKAEPGEYTIKSNYYYSGGDGDAHATVTVILYGDNPARRIVRVFGPHLQVDTKTGEDYWEVAKFKMPEGIFLEE